MPKRQITSNLPDFPTLSLEYDVKPDLPFSSNTPQTDRLTASTPKSKTKKAGQAGSNKKAKKDDGSPAKTRWTAEEDQTLLTLLDEVLKVHLWAAVKAEGSLVHRTSYGVQYHAKMLLKQGVKK